MRKKIDDPTKPAPRKARRFGIGMLLSLALLGGLIVVAGLSITKRSIAAPQWLEDRMVTRINSSLRSGRITLGRLQMQINGRGVPRILLGNLGIFDDRGVEVARLNEVSARFSLRALVGGQFKPQVIRLSGAQMTLRRRVDGQFDLSFGTGTATTGTLPGVLDQIDAAFATPALETLTLLDASDLTITLEDARSGRLWQITEGRLQIRRAADGLDISVAFDVFNGTEELAETVVGIRTRSDSSRASIGTTFRNAAAADIALQSPALRFLGVLNALISGSVRVDFDAGGALTGLAGTMEIGAGVLQPTAGARALGFDSGKSYFDYDPASEKLTFTELSVQSDTVSAVVSGHAYLREFQDGWPSALIGQFTLSDLVAHPENLFEQPVTYSQGAVDFRLRLNPFAIEIGQLVLIEGDEKLIGTGVVAAGDGGWDISGDLSLNQIGKDRLLGFWPVTLAPLTRDWLITNFQAGTLTDVTGAVRLKPGQDLRGSLGFRFQDGAFRYITSQPKIENAAGYGIIDGKVFTLVFENGTVTAPIGGLIDVTGSVLQVPDITASPTRAEISLVIKSAATATLSLLDEPPFNILRRTGYGPDLAEGRAEFTVEIGFDLIEDNAIEDVTYSAVGDLLDIRSDKLIRGRVLSSDALSFRADNGAIEISGPVRLGQLSAEMIWRQELEPEQAGRSTVNGTVELSQKFVDELGIGLPKGSVSGAGVGRFELQLVRGRPPEFTLSSDLNRIGLSIAPIGWSKPPNATGRLDVAGHLGERPVIDRLSLTASGLDASGGRITMAADGAMRSATFERVRVGGWLDAPVTLTGRGPGQVPSVLVTGGTINVRKTAFGGAGNRANSSNGGPISLAMDRVIVSEGISLTGFIGELDSSGGLSGTFSARLNGRTPLTGRLAPDKNGTAIRIKSTNAGGILRDAGVFENARGGTLDMTLRPQAQNGVYNGRMTASNIRVIDAPALTELLSAISIIGLLDQLGSEGILFTDVEADFQLSPQSVRLIRSSAVGPSLGVSLSGTYDLTTSRMILEGVMSPIFFLNAVGQVLSRRGEGLFGFNFSLTGSASAPNVKVNPLSILAPGGLRDIFRRSWPKTPAPDPTQ
jgi:hypothetical protein